MGRQQRLLEMLVALQTRHRTTAAELAEEFGVSERTVLRDVGALADADIPVFAERGRYGGIVLLPGAQINLSRLTGPETEVLQLLGVDLARARQLGIEAAARGAARKLTARRTSPPVTHAEPSIPLALGEVVTIDNRGWFATDDNTDVASLARDLRQGRRLRITYRRSGQQHGRQTVVDPYGVLLRSERWYLVADVDGTPRLYALSRMQSWEVLDEPRRLRPGTTLAEVARTLGDELEGRHKVTITAELDAARVDLATRILGARLTATEPATRPDTVRITVAYDQIGAVRQLLQFGEHIRITAPPEARELFHRLATAIVREHAGDLKPSAGQKADELTHMGEETP